ncbi:hypothetical protein BDR06DRAFT_970249 [Suillus hirtellus]|nr:hypothetical protein BDR06DRAFT_970249 [Suillus hirtellus]
MCGQKDSHYTVYRMGDGTEDACANVRLRSDQSTGTYLCKPTEILVSTAKIHIIPQLPAAKRVVVSGSTKGLYGRGGCFFYVSLVLLNTNKEKRYLGMTPTTLAIELPCLLSLRLGILIVKEAMNQLLDRELMQMCTLAPTDMRLKPPKHKQDEGDSRSLKSKGTNKQIA